MPYLKFLIFGCMDHDPLVLFGCYCCSKLILLCYQVLWPNGTFFLNLENGQDEVDGDEFNQKLIQTASRLGGRKVPRPGSAFEMKLEAARRASDVKKMLLGEMSSITNIYCSFFLLLLLF